MRYLMSSVTEHPSTKSSYSDPNSEATGDTIRDNHTTGDSEIQCRRTASIKYENMTCVE